MVAWVEKCTKLLACVSNKGDYYVTVKLFKQMEKMCSRTDKLPDRSMHSNVSYTCGCARAHNTSPSATSTCKQHYEHARHLYNGQS